MKFPRHTGAHRGKKVVVTLRNGARFIDTFVERDDRNIYLTVHGKVPKWNLRALTIWRGQADGQEK